MITLFYNYTRCYLLPLNQGWLMLDTDMPNALPLLYRALKEANVALSDVRYLLVSHFHPDHGGLAQDLKEHGVQLLLMDFQRDTLNDWLTIFKNDKRMRPHPINEWDNLMLIEADSRAFLSEIGLQGEILHTPGHSADSATLLLDDGTAFIGDLPLPHLVEGFDNPEMVKSWERIKSRQPKLIYTAHWLPYTLE